MLVFIYYIFICSYIGFYIFYIVFTIFPYPLIHVDCLIPITVVSQTISNRVVIYCSKLGKLNYHDNLSVAT